VASFSSTELVFAEKTYFFLFKGLSTRRRIRRAEMGALTLGFALLVALTFFTALLLLISDFFWVMTKSPSHFFLACHCF
jgi:hypothetical protein